MSFAGLLILAVFGAFVLGGIVLLAALLSNEKTRSFGYALLAVPLVLVVVAFAGLFFARLTAVPKPQISQIGHFPQQQIQQNKQIANSASMEAYYAENGKLFVEADDHNTVAAENNNQEPAKPAGDGESKTADDSETTKSVIRALSTAFAQTLAEIKGRTPQDNNNTKNNAKIITENDTEQAAENANAENAGTEKINQMVEILSGAVRQEVPDDIEVDQYTALRALGKLLGRLIVSEQQEGDGAAAEPANGAATDPASGKQSRPGWVDAQPGRVGDAYQMVVVAGPYTTRLECDQAISAQLYQAVDEYAELYLGDGRGRQVSLTDEFLRKHVVAEEWEEHFQSSVGPMVRLHARLMFDARTNSELKDRFRRAIVAQRLVIAGGGLAATLLLLGGCFGALRLDAATAGRYRGRMVFAVVVGTVMASSILGTRLLLSPRTTIAPARPLEIMESPATVSAVTAEAVAVPGSPTVITRSWAILFAAVPLLCLTAGFLAFRKTRHFAIIFVLAGVAVALGAVLLIS